MTFDDLRAGAGSTYLFHYTDEIRADLIVESRIFATGPSAVHGVGVYATDIAPVDEETLEDVIVRCFGGDAIPAEVDHAIAVRVSSGGRLFKQTSNPDEWVLPTQKLEVVSLDGFYVAATRFDGTGWEIFDDEN